MKIKLCAHWTVLFGVVVVHLAAGAATNEWYPGGSGFTGWPTNWVEISSLNDPKDKSAADARLDFVGDVSNPGGYWSANSNYFFVRMRVAVSNVISTTFTDAHWVYIDRIDYTNGAADFGMPDYALAWDSKSGDVAEHGLELMTGTNLTAKPTWGVVAMPDIDGLNAKKTAPPDFNLTGDGYIRTIDMRPTTNFGYTTFIDFAVKWSFISANTVLNTNQQWRLQFGSRNNATDHSTPTDDVAGGFTPDSVVTNSFSSVIASRPLSSSIDLSVYATATGVVAEVWTADESGHDDIVVYVWREDDWVEVGRVSPEGEGSHCYALPLTGLLLGEAYLFKVVDEAGLVHVLPFAVEVKTIRVSALRMDLQTFEMTFDTDAGRQYEVLESDNLVTWQRALVSYPLANGTWSGPARASFTAGPGSLTKVHLPVNGRKRAYFKIRRVLNE